MDHVKATFAGLYEQVTRKENGCPVFRHTTGRAWLYHDLHGFWMFTTAEKEVGGERGEIYGKPLYEKFGPAQVRVWLTNTGVLKANGERSTKKAGSPPVRAGMPTFPFLV